jgi:hypothetical protein
VRNIVAQGKVEGIGKGKGKDTDIGKEKFYRH